MSHHRDAEARRKAKPVLTCVLGRRQVTKLMKRLPCSSLFSIFSVTLWWVVVSVQNQQTPPARRQQFYRPARGRSGRPRLLRAQRSSRGCVGATPASPTRRVPGLQSKRLLSPLLKPAIGG